MNTATLPLCLMNITSYSRMWYQGLTTGTKEIEFKDMIGRELDITIIFRKKVVRAWALASYIASS